MIVRFLIPVVCSVLLSGCAVAQAPLSTDPKAPISIVVSGPASASASSDIEIHVVITNTSDHEAVGVTFEGTAEWNYHIGVTDDKGIPPQSTEYGLRTRGYPQGSRAFVRLQPKESRDETLLLNKLFALVPGKTYHVQVQRNDRYNATPTLTAKSNIFTIAITQ